VVVERKAHVAGPQTNSPRSLYTSHHPRIITCPAAFYRLSHHHGPRPLSVYPFRLMSADLSVDRRDRFVFFVIAFSSHSLFAFSIPRSFQILDFARTKLEATSGRTFSAAIVSHSFTFTPGSIMQGSFRTSANSRVAVRRGRARVSPLGIALPVSSLRRGKKSSAGKHSSRTLRLIRVPVSRGLSPPSSSARQADRHLSPSCCLRVVADSTLNLYCPSVLVV
jgi:hypothetical protein